MTPTPPNPETTVPLAEVTRYGPALRRAVRALEAEAREHHRRFCPTDAETVWEVVGELEDLAALLHLDGSLDPQPDARTHATR